jgi:hypothetical protein
VSRAGGSRASRMTRRPATGVLHPGPLRADAICASRVTRGPRRPTPNCRSAEAPPVRRGRGRFLFVLEETETTTRLLVRPRAVTPRPRPAQLLRGPRACGSAEHEPSCFLFFIFLHIKFILCIYDYWTPGYAVAHPAYPVGPPLLSFTTDTNILL